MNWILLWSRNQGRLLNKWRVTGRGPWSADIEAFRSLWTVCWEIFQFLILTTHCDTVPLLHRSWIVWKLCLQVSLNLLWNQDTVHIQVAGLTFSFSLLDTTIGKFPLKAFEGYECDADALCQADRWRAGDDYDMAKTKDVSCTERE
jgi:hypothetical protein